MYRIELFVLSACGMYVCLSRVSLHASPHILCHSRCLLHRLETETRRAALDAAAATGAEAATRRSCADARAALFLGRGGVVVHAVGGDVLVVHAGLRGLDAGVRGRMGLTGGWLRQVSRGTGAEDIPGVVVAAWRILAGGRCAVRGLGLAAVELVCRHGGGRVNDGGSALKGELEGGLGENETIYAGGV